ncbi:MAG: hypothetical protein M3178_08520 [Pseudomonadota bacterium]|nr:hypothetical protein [Pseudomonadota bacterium]
MDWCAYHVELSGRRAELAAGTKIQMLVKEYDAINRPTRRLRLTFDGWQRWEALNREEFESFTAFMAMQFDSEMDRVV